MVFCQLGVADMKRDLRVKIATLADKKLGAVGVIDQVFIPATVAGVQHGFSIHCHSVAQRDVLLLVRNPKRKDLSPAQSQRLLRRELVKFQGKRRIAL